MRERRGDWEGKKGSDLQAAGTRGGHARGALTAAPAAPAAPAGAAAGALGESRPYAAANATASASANARTPQRRRQRLTRGGWGGGARGAAGGERREQRGRAPGLRERMGLARRPLRRALLMNTPQRSNDEMCEWQWREGKWVMVCWSVRKRGECKEGVMGVVG